MSSTEGDLHPVKTEIIFGVHPVLEALIAARRKFYDIWILEKHRPRRLEKITNLAESFNIPLKMLSRSHFQTMTGTDEHQGVFARVGPYPFANMADIFNRNDPFLLLLDNMMDPRNLGAVIRTALCSGIHGIMLPKDRSAAPTAVVSKSSAGALEHAQIVKVNNLTATIRILKDKGIWIVGLDQHAEQPIFKIDLKSPVALVVGGEDKGIRPIVKKNCDFLVCIPQQGPVGSFNASVAGAMAMYEVVRQRHNPP